MTPSEKIAYAEKCGWQINIKPTRVRALTPSGRAVEYAVVVQYGGISEAIEALQHSLTSPGGLWDYDEEGKERKHAAHMIADRLVYEKYKDQLDRDDLPLVFKIAAEAALT